MKRYSAFVATVVLLAGAAGSWVHGQSPTASALPRFPSPELPVYGHAASNTNCIYVVGLVNRPGVYYLVGGSTVGDAIKAAQGLARFADWRYSGMARPSISGAPEARHFSDRNQDEKIKLRDGDQIYFGMESF